MKPIQAKALPGDMDITLDSWTMRRTGGDQYISPLEAIKNISISSLRNAILKHWNDEFSEEDKISAKSWPPERVMIEDGPRLLDSVLISNSPISEYSEEYSPLEPIEFLVTNNGEFLVRSQFFDLGQAEPSELAMLVEPYLTRNRAGLASIEVEGEGTQAYFFIDFWVKERGRTIGNAYEIATGLIDLVDCFSGNPVKLGIVADILNSGKWETLLGQPENSWLEVKSVPYRIDEEPEKHEFAKDVCSLANSRIGGVLIIGMKSKHKNGMDIIDKITPVQDGQKIVSRYKSIIRKYIYPAPEDFEVSLIKRNGEGLLLIQVPAQQEETKPHIVYGASISGKVKGSYFSIPQRNGDATVATSPAAIHAMLTVGRALLRSDRNADQQS